MSILKSSCSLMVEIGTFSSEHMLIFWYVCQFINKHATRFIYRLIDIIRPLCLGHSENSFSSESMWKNKSALPGLWTKNAASNVLDQVEAKVDGRKRQKVDGPWAESGRFITTFDETSTFDTVHFHPISLKRVGVTLAQSPWVPCFITYSVWSARVIKINFSYSSW